MAIKLDRVGKALNTHLGRTPHVLVTPEGIPLMTSAATLMERISALFIDLSIMFFASLLLGTLLLSFLFNGVLSLMGLTIVQFLIFVIRMLYFTHFELAWQGQTPGKRLCGLRVVNYKGGELTASAIIARNITREVEIFQPLTFIFFFGFHSFGSVALLFWTILIALVPFKNKKHRRAGDFIANTIVIHMPKEQLLPDLAYNGTPQVDTDAAEATGNSPSELENTPTSQTEKHKASPFSRLPGQASMRAFGKKILEAADNKLPPLPPVDNDNGPVFTFSPNQLSVYGIFELQILEEFLRRPETPQNIKNLEEICHKICHKIQWTGTIPPRQVRRFLTDFYAAERAELERGQLFGKVKEDKFS